jgi:hypothetical protein
MCVRLNVMYMSTVLRNKANENQGMMSESVKYNNRKREKESPADLHYVRVKVARTFVI